MNNYWLINLKTLLVKYSELGIDADLASLNVNDAWGLYLHLTRLAES